MEEEKVDIHQEVREMAKILRRVEQRVIELEMSQRMAMSTINSMARIQKRNQDKMMDGFKAIQKAFYMACGAAVDSQEELSEHLGILKI